MVSLLEAFVVQIGIRSRTSWATDMLVLLVSYKYFVNFSSCIVYLETKEFVIQVKKYF